MQRVFYYCASGIVMGLAAIAARFAGLPPQDAVSARNIPFAFGPIHPRLSADGGRIALSYLGTIWRLPRDGGVLTRLSRGAGFDIEPCWSPDGMTIAYVHAPQVGGGEVRILNAETGDAIPLSVKVQSVDSVGYAKLEFHPDGRLLGNLRVGDESVGIALVNLRDGQFQKLIAPPRQSRFALSPDGKWLAYSVAMDIDGQQWGNDGPQADLFQLPIAGGKPTLITRFPSRIHDLSWSADGRSVVVVSELGGAHYDLWQVPLADPERGTKRLTLGQADEERPSVSADGRWLLYTDNRAGVTALTLRDLTTGIDSTVQPMGVDFKQPTGTLRLSARNKTTGSRVTARVSIERDGGGYYSPPETLYRVLDDYQHFYCTEQITFGLPAGKYRLRAFHGPEYRTAHVAFDIVAGETRDLVVDLERWTNSAEQGWYSGENHIHANYGYGQWYNTPESMLAQCAGENLRVCNFMVANSDTDGVFDREFFRGRLDPLSTDETLLYWNQEFRSTSWGHMTLVNLSQLVEPVFTGFKDTTNPWDVPTNSEIAGRARLQHGLVNYTHGAQNPDDPYLGAYTAKGIPVDVAAQMIDTMDLNASYAGTVPLWYRLLNCGFRLPASAGTDCFLNRIRSRLPGGDRAYVKVDGPFSYKAWIEGLRAGRSFVTNGPMLKLEVEGLGAGESLALVAPREVHIVGQARSQFPMKRLEVVVNGKVEHSGKLSQDELTANIDTRIKIARSGWISLRAYGPGHADHPSGSQEAHTSPVYVSVGNRPIASRDDAEYFVKWIDRLAVDLRVRDRFPSPAHRDQVQRHLESARAVYSRIAESAE